MDTLKNMTPLQWLIILMSFNSAVAGATAQLNDLFGAVVAHYIVSGVTFANTLLGAFMVPLGGQSAAIRNVLAMPGVEHLSVNAQANQTLASIAVDRTVAKIDATPAAKGIVSEIAKGAAILLLAIVLPYFLLSGSAMAQGRSRPAAIPNPIDQFNQKLKDDFTAKTGVQATGDLPFDLLQALDKKLLPDLQYALKLAQATGSTVTAPCYQAWIDMINTQQTAVQTKNADGTAADIPVPDPHLVTDFERMVELRNALQPESKFMVACSPVANMIKQDVISFMGKVISGGAGIATLVPGL